MFYHFYKNSEIAPGKFTISMPKFDENNTLEYSQRNITYRKLPVCQMLSGFRLLLNSISTSHFISHVSVIYKFYSNGYYLKMRKTIRSVNNRNHEKNIIVVIFIMTPLFSWLLTFKFAKKNDKINIKVNNYNIKMNISIIEFGSMSTFILLYILISQ